MNHDVVGTSLISIEELLQLIVGTRFISNFLTTFLTLWTYIKYGNPTTTGDDSLSVLVFVFFLIVASNDLSSLPVNIFYIWSLQSGLNLSLEWV